MAFPPVTEDQFDLRNHGKVVVFPFTAITRDVGDLGDSSGGTLIFRMLNRIYRGTPAVASRGYPEARAALLEEPFSSHTENRDKTNSA